MIAESYLWQRLPQESLSAAEQFLATHDAAQLKQEVATAHLFAGESLQVLGQHLSAVPHYQWIKANYAPQQEIWPRLDLVARAYFRTFDALWRGGGDQAQILVAAQDVIAGYPGTAYAQAVLNATGGP